MYFSAIQFSFIISKIIIVINASKCVRMLRIVYFNENLSGKEHSSFCIGAIHRYYESRRRLYNDSQPLRRDSARKAKHAANKKERRKRVRLQVKDMLHSIFTTYCTFLIWCSSLDQCSPILAMNSKMLMGH